MMNREPGNGNPTKRSIEYKNIITVYLHCITKLFTYPLWLRVHLHTQSTQFVYLNNALMNFKLSMN